MENELIIHPVNLELLEKQRLILSTIERHVLSKKQADALEGIQSMLDYWSDRRVDHDQD